MKRSDLFQSRLRFDVHAVTVELHVTRDLKVILLLADERVVRVGKVETFVGVDAEVRDGSVGGREKLLRQRDENNKEFFLQFLVVVVE